ncbi:hypothetical protein [Halorientalis halophila]|uniref:hypothetical protein n=1 Tax=Halorientalis halophila TaxID=3108499 RepID=UPI00300A70FF
MTQDTAQSPVAMVGSLVRNAWRTMKTIYYANSLSWRFLKAGALVFMGFFLWSASNLLLSYQPAWNWLHYPMAYGFLVLLYGPVHHFVVIPLALRLRRSGGRRTTVGTRLPNAALVAFLIAVVLLGTFPTAPVTFDFQSSLEDAGADVNPDLQCTKSTSGDDTTIHCHLTESDGIDSVAVVTGGDQLTVDDDPPFDFDVRESRLQEVTGEKQFQVVLRDENGDTIRRYTRTVSMIREG